MIGAALASWFLTPRAIHRANEFDWFPLKEVAWLFAGIFAAMIPALEFLQRHAHQLALHSPLQFYAFTGALSGVLDNAPTYLAFLATAFGLADLQMDNPADFAHFIATRGDLLLAISVASVFFGAMTYIGNGPNFMVKSIAQHLKVETPSFFGYVLRFSLPVLLPLLVLIGVLFFSKWRLF
jgi:Na+/H+ antiporter NhaD/arsenite permease-like protein